MDRAFRLLSSLALCWAATSCIAIQASPQTQPFKVTNKEHSLSVTAWHSTASKADRALVLLSGPTENWNSDSAWFARLAPKLAKHYQVWTIDRAGQINSDPNVPLGYKQFGEDLTKIIPQLTKRPVTVLAFASSNLAIHSYFAALAGEQAYAKQIQSVIMIDPDVLRSYSISRYQSDAKWFKDNREKFAQYISQGKYDERAKQKNDQERKKIKALAEKDGDVDWAYFEKVLESRLENNNLQNLASELAVYDADLEFANIHPLPQTLSLIVIDTDFENEAIRKAETETEKKGLLRWQSEATDYYQSLASKHLNSQYIHIQTEEHLLPFSDPEFLISLLKKIHR